MTSDLMSNKAICDAFEKFIKDHQPFDGVFYIEDMDQTLKVPQRTTMGELEQMVQEVEDKRKRLAELADWLDRHTDGDPQLAAELLGLEKQRRENREKVKVPCQLKVRDDKICIELPDKSLKKITFGRGNPAKTLYIFFLRQIERAEEDRNASTCLSQVEMEAYKDDLFYIYQNISGKKCKMQDVESWLKKGTLSNEFANAAASIRKYFDTLFDVLTLKFKFGKCYSIEIMGKDRFGNPRYGIDLKTSDFDLGWYSNNR
jgi:hypothetical protein